MDNINENCDAVVFVKEHCIRNGLPLDTIQSPAEREACAKASEAKELYKSLLNYRHPFSGTLPSTPPSILPRSPPSHVITANDKEERCMQRMRIAEEKKRNRLRNNRKSALATKVYNEIYKREVSHALHHVVTGVRGKVMAQASVSMTLNEDRMRRLEARVMQLQAENAEVIRDHAKTKSRLCEALMRLEGLTSEQSQVHMIPIHRHEKSNSMTRSSVGYFPRRVTHAARVTDSSVEHHQPLLAQEASKSSIPVGLVLESRPMDVPCAQPGLECSEMARTYQDSCGGSACSGEILRDTETNVQYHGSCGESSNVPHEC